MKKYIYWVFVILVVVLGIYLITQSSLQPQTLPKIKYSQVQSPERFGEAIMQRLREEIRQAPLVLLGVTPNQDQEMTLWKGFLAANQEPGMKYDLVIVEEGLNGVEKLPYQMKLDLKKDALRFVEGVTAALGKNLRVAVIAPNIYTSQLIQKNLAAYLKSEAKVPVTSFSVSGFPESAEKESQFEPRCSVDKEDSVGTGPLGCNILTKARQLYRKTREKGKYSGLMDQTGASDYLVLFSKNQD